MSHLPHQNGAHLEVSGTSSPEPFFIPPHPAGTIALLRERGHTVTVRRNKNYSLRYRIDGGREMLAIEMSRFFARRYEA